MSFKDLIERLERLQGKSKFDGTERRKYARLTFPPKKRPMLKVRDLKLEILDISEKGMRLLNYMNYPLGQQIHGTVTFSSGMSIDIVGKIVWQFKNELGLLTTPIPRHIITEEIYALLREKELKDPYKLD